MTINLFGFIAIMLIGYLLGKLTEITWNWIEEIQEDKTLEYAIAIIYCIISFIIDYGIIRFMSMLFDVTFPFWFIVTVWGVSDILLIVSCMNDRRQQ